ncbi:hypothetical protein BN1088_1431303 [Sphingobacterium sp. PM2-P1-29]|nr:hypothetical protein BN1088_1431303 [Sphingobacterium sp. PM2-P1-29]
MSILAYLKMVASVEIEIEKDNIGNFINHRQGGFPPAVRLDYGLNSWHKG